MGTRSATLSVHGDEFAWSLLDATPDATLIVASSGEIVFVNDHAGVVFGYAGDQLLGQKVETLIPVAQAQVHRAHRTRYRAQPAVRAMGAGSDLWARRSDGTEFPVEISLSPLVLGDDSFVVASVRDVTSRVQAEAEMHRVLRTLDAMDDGIFILDSETMVHSFVNDGAVRLTGYCRDELLTMTLLHLDPNTTKSAYRRLIASLIDEAASVTQQATMLRKDGSEVVVEEAFRSGRVGREGNAWVIVLVRDITSRLNQEAELEQSRRALRAAETAVAVIEDRERIARDLHDTVIQRLFVEGLNLQTTLRLVDGRAAARIQNTIEGLDDTIKDLRMAIFALQGAVAAPGGVRGQLLDTIQHATECLGFDPRLQFDGPIETVDEHIVKELIPVLTEALSNVARHAQASIARVAVTVNDHVTLAVSDDGVGVPDQVLGGRGLSNLAQRAERLGGRLTLVRREPRGSVLTWRVPTDHAPSDRVPRCSGTDGPAAT